MTQIFGIIVVYNKNVCDSVTYQCIKKQGRIKMIVCDNSTKDYGNRDIVVSDGYQYVDMHGNQGLSKAYNKALDVIHTLNPSMKGYVMLFDDDTDIPEDYFKQMYRALEQPSAHIYLPIVKDEIGVLSPSMMKKYYCHRAIGGDVWKIRQNELCGINSGMVIYLGIFRKYRYNEALFLDYVDHNFIRDMRRRYCKIQIVDTCLYQSFSSNIYDEQKELARLKIFEKDIRAFYRKGFVSKAFFHYTMIRRKMKLALKYKKPGILFR